MNFVKPDVDECRERSAHAPLFAFPAVSSRRYTAGGDTDDECVPLAVEYGDTLHLDDLE